MSLLDELLKTDAQVLEQPATETFVSQHLSRKLGKKAEITLQELPPRRATNLIKTQFNKDGSFDYVKSHEAKLKVVADGVAEPNLKDKKLQEHFGCDTATELAEKLFSLEITDISSKILELSGITDDADQIEERDDEIKNC